MDQSEYFRLGFVLYFAQGAGFVVSGLSRRGLSDLLQYDFYFALVGALSMGASLSTYQGLEIYIWTMDQHEGKDRRTSGRCAYIVILSYPDGSKANAD